jgi:hypothetical protein
MITSIHIKTAIDEDKFNNGPLYPAGHSGQKAMIFSSAKRPFVHAVHSFCALVALTNPGWHSLQNVWERFR